jgi:DsbC/DsbD-like thiol-disulfide interchange protein
MGRGPASGPAPFRLLRHLLSRLRPLRLAALLTVAITFPAAARQKPVVDFTSAGSQPAVQETEHLTIKVSSGGPASPGSRLSLFLNITPKPRMHVYAPGQKTYIPVSVQLTEEPAITAQRPVFPSPEKYFFKPLKEIQLVYSKPFRIVQDVILADAPTLYHTSTLTIAGTVRYQACDDEICYLPKSVAVTWKVPLILPDTIK